MIFFDIDENKKITLFFLVTFSMLFIVFQWFKYNPITSVANDEVDNTYWLEFDKQFSNTKKALENNFAVAEIKLNKLKEESEQEAREEILLQSAREYLENKKNVTSSNATSTE